MGGRVFAAVAAIAAIRNAVTSSFFMNSPSFLILSLVPPARPGLMRLHQREKTIHLHQHPSKAPDR
jgi:hypothetical protein